MDFLFFFFFSSRRRHTRFSRDWSSDVCSSDLELAQLLERVDAGVRIGADTEVDSALADSGNGYVAVAEVRLGRRADADPSLGAGDEVELAVVCVRGVDDRRQRPETTGVGEHLDRAPAMLGQGLLDLAGL